MAKSIFCSPIFSSAQGWHFVGRQLLLCPEQPGEKEGSLLSEMPWSQGSSPDVGGGKHPYPQQWSQHATLAAPACPVFEAVASKRRVLSRGELKNK